MWYGKPRLQGRVGSIACLHRRALARESPEERETGRRANTDAMREARARESQEEGDTRQRATPRPKGRFELGSLGKKERLGSEPTPMPIADRGWSPLLKEAQY